MNDHPIKSVSNLEINGIKILNEGVSNDTITGPLLITGIRKRYIIFRIRLHTIRLAIQCYRNPVHWFGMIGYFINFRRKYLGDNKHNRLVKVDGRYYMGLYTPGWKSKAFDKFIISFLNDYKPISKKSFNRFMFAFIAMTKKCPLKCEHCYEWENLNNKETLTSEDVQQIVRKIQDFGVSQIQLTGGEPMNRIHVLLEVLNNSADESDFWITTSGYNLTYRNAMKLKEAGLTGVVVSLDHFIPEKHNGFRGNDKAFQWAMDAIKNAHSNGLVTALSLCATKEFSNRQNMMSYMELAKKMQVSFVQLLEPRPVGHYRGFDVSLSDEQIGIMEEIVLDFNFNPRNKEFPFINYHAYHQRRHGCLSSGNKGIYIDTDGDLNPCPFCQKKTGNVLDEKFEEHLEQLKVSGCGEF